MLLASYLFVCGPQTPFHALQRALPVPTCLYKSSLTGWAGRVCCDCACAPFRAHVARCLVVCSTSNPFPLSLYQCKCRFSCVPSAVGSRYNIHCGCRVSKTWPCLYRTHRWLCCKRRGDGLDVPLVNALPSPQREGGARGRAGGGVVRELL